MAIDINTVIENLNELLTNSVNLTDKYYDLFINPEPMMIDLELYNEDNQLVTVTVPNRAMDRENFGQLIEKVDALAEVASTGEYTDLKNAPNGTLTIQGNGSTIATFNNSSSTDVIADIQYPTRTSQLVNDAGFITDGNNRLHALKGYEDAGELLTDSEGLADVTKYAHSTYCGDQADTASPLDAKKFTYQNGYKPTITNDGLISNITTTNAIYVPRGINVANPWEIEEEVTITQSSAEQRIYQNKPTLSGDIANTIIVYFTADLEFKIYLSNTITGDIANAASLNYIATAGETLKTRLLFTGTAYEFYVNGVKTWSLNSTTKIGATRQFYVFSGQGYAPMLGTQNLKTVLIKQNGIPVFSGHKTGIDTIKPDDYTVVGNPPISADGVATFTVPGQYLTFNRPADMLTRSWCIKGFVNSLDQISYNAIVKLDTSNYKNRLSFASDLSFISFSLYDGTSDYDSNHINLDFNNHSFNYEWGFDGIETYILKVKRDIDTDWQIVTMTLNNPIVTDGDAMCISAPVQGIRGSIDLNAFKIYVDGNLVYQPCLKIPYTESKTGSKIVDSIYRDRVNDMYEQFGYAPYYTLSDTDFTLPQGEIYGMLGNRKWQFVPSTSQTLSASTAVGTYTIDLSSILPNDGYYYECIFTYAIVSYPTSYINSNYTATIDNIVYLYDAVDNESSASKTVGGQFIGIAKYNSTMDITISSYQLDAGSYLKILAYKKSDY